MSYGEDILRGMIKVGDQWVEKKDGQEHMMKLINTSYMVNGTLLQTAVRVVDLGVLKDGLLPCPVCGEYPKRVEISYHSYCIICNKGNHDFKAFPEDGKNNADKFWNRRA